MPWWKPEEEESPQSRVGRSQRVGATSRPVDEGEATVPPPTHSVSSADEPGAQNVPIRSWGGTPSYGAGPGHPPLPRRRFPMSIPIAIVALLFVGLMVLPFVAAFKVFDDGGGGGFSTDSHDGPSLVPRERFAKAMAKIREEAGSEASLTVLRVEPERIDAVVTKAGGGTASIQVLPDLYTRSFGAGTSGQRGLSLGRVDPAVPERLVRRAAERLRTSPKDLSYMALTGIKQLGGGGVWSVFFTGGGAGRYVIADLDGGNLRVPGQ